MRTEKAVTPHSGKPFQEKITEIMGWAKRPSITTFFTPVALGPLHMGISCPRDAFKLLKPMKLHLLKEWMSSSLFAPCRSHSEGIWPRCIQSSRKTCSTQGRKSALTSLCQAHWVYCQTLLAGGEQIFSDILVAWQEHRALPIAQKIEWLCRKDTVT